MDLKNYYCSLPCLFPPPLLPLMPSLIYVSLSSSITVCSWPCYPSAEEDWNFPTPNASSILDHVVLQNVVELSILSLSFLFFLSVTQLVLWSTGLRKTDNIGDFLCSLSQGSLSPSI